MTPDTREIIRRIQAAIWTTMSALMLLITSLTPWAWKRDALKTGADAIETRLTLWDLTLSRINDDVTQYSGLGVAALLITCMMLVFVAAYPGKRPSSWPPPPQARTCWPSSYYGPRRRKLPTSSTVT